MLEQMFALAPKTLIPTIPEHAERQSAPRVSSKHKICTLAQVLPNTACLHLSSRQAMLNAGDKTDAEVIHTDRQ